MDFKAIFSIFICALSIKLSSCGPLGTWGLFRAPDPDQGVGCSRPPNFGEYCDKYGSGRIQRCSPCSIAQLGNTYISFPEDCANVPCPYRCPEEISDRASPAPPDSCDITTPSLTTNDVTTDLPSTTAAATTSTTTTTETPTEPPPGLTTTQPYDPLNKSNLERNIRIAVIVSAVIAVLVVSVIVYVCMKKCRRCNRAVPPSSSTEPMMPMDTGYINGIEMTMTPPQTPTSPVPVLIPGKTSVAITTTDTERDLYVKLDCECAEDQPIHIGPEGGTLEGLSPSTRYHVSMGTMREGDFHPEHHDVVETIGETQPELDTCFTLQDLKQHIENNTVYFQNLKALFGHIGVETAQDRDILRGLSRVLGVLSLVDVAGHKLLEEVIDIDNQLKEEGNSVKVYSIIQALVVNLNAQVPDFVIEISQKLSSIHKDCLPCRHQVCQLTRNSNETCV